MRKRVRNEIFNEDSDIYIYAWNLRFPFDYWWRKLYKVSFGSSEHRETSVVDMYIEFMEFKLFKDKDDNEEVYKRGSGSIFKESSVGRIADLDSMFDNINISKLNE